MILLPDEILQVDSSKLAGEGMFETASISRLSLYTIAMPPGEVQWTQLILKPSFAKSKAAIHVWSLSFNHVSVIKQISNWALSIYWWSTESFPLTDWALSNQILRSFVGMINCGPKLVSIHVTASCTEWPLSLGQRNLWCPPFLPLFLHFCSLRNRILEHTWAGSLLNVLEWSVHSPYPCSVGES